MVRSIIATLHATNRDEVAVGMTRPERRCVDHVVRALQEPGRTIFLSRENGMTPDEISREMGIERQEVCRTLARIYSQIRVALTDYEAPA